jgi:hypothetical protein
MIVFISKRTKIAVLTCQEAKHLSLGQTCDQGGAPELVFVARTINAASPRDYVLSEANQDEASAEAYWLQRKRHSFLSLRYVCLEPVLAK